MVKFCPECGRNVEGNKSCSHCGLLKINDIDEKEKSKNFFKGKIGNYLKQFLIVASSFGVIYQIVDYLYEYLFQIRCEKFYGIPRGYFSTDINPSLLYLGVILLFGSLFFAPLFLRRYEENKIALIIESVFLSIVLGVGLGVVNLFNLLEIMKATNNKNEFWFNWNNWLAQNDGVIVKLIFLSSILASLIIFLSPYIKFKRIKNILLFTTAICFTICFTISFLLLLYGTACKLRINIEEETQYETVTCDGEQYVVITEKNDKLLVTKYEEDVIDNGIKVTVLHTSQYLFLDKSNCNFSYKNFAFPIKPDNTQVDN